MIKGKKQFLEYFLKMFVNFITNVKIILLMMVIVLDILFDMQTNIEVEAPIKSTYKKKKNRWANQTPSQPLHQQSQAQNYSNISKNQPSKDKDSTLGSTKQKQSNKMKKLNEMINLYHMDMSLELGSGFASVVYFGKSLLTEATVCIKVIDLHILQGEKQRLCLQRQIRYLNQIDSQYTVKLLDSFESPSFIYLVMEFCQAGDLFRFLITSPPLHPLFVREIVEQISQGLAVLKTNNLIHRDLKTENIFLSKNLKPKIGDLGFCIAVDQEEIIHNVGSPIYMSPQVLQGNPHSFASDIYGLGIIWYQLLHKKAPWQATTESELLLNKTTIELTFERTDLSEGDKALIKKCLQIRTQDRCTLYQVISYCSSVNETQKQALLSQLKQQ